LEQTVVLSTVQLTSPRVAVQQKAKKAIPLQSLSLDGSTGLLENNTQTK